MAKQDLKNPETTKVELTDIELVFMWQCMMNAQIPAAAAEVVVALKQKLGPDVEAASKRAQAGQAAQQAA